MSYDGQINFGLVSDYDVVPDLDDLAVGVAAAMDALAAAAGVEPAALRAPAEVGRGEPPMGFPLPRSRPEGRARRPARQPG